MPDRCPIGRLVGLPTLFLLLITALAAPPANAQIGGEAQPALGSSGEIAIETRWFGAGGVTRQGEWVGLRVDVTDSFDRPREVVVRVGIDDVDGDRLMSQRVVTTNPGVRQQVWIYFRIPFQFDQRQVLRVTANAAIEDDLGGDPLRLDPSAPKYSAGRLLGEARIASTRQPVSSVEGLIGVVGRKSLALKRFEQDAGRRTGRGAWHPTGHERTEIITGLDASTLPDRWMGLAQFDTLVWSEGQPGQLGPDTAHAIREWVRRGGHLVIVLPRIGQGWTDEVNNPLYDLVPRVSVQRRDSYDLNLLRPLLVVDSDPARLLPLPDSEAVQFFVPHEEDNPSWNSGATRIMEAPDGGCFVVRRNEGVGAVTMIGLDLSSRWLSDRDLPDPEIFWNRILGRRGTLYPDREAATLTDSRQIVTLDADVSNEIARTGRAEAGVLIGFVVFVTYWFVAGPAGFYVLKRYGYVRHAWVAFLCAAGVFTAIAWGGATAIKPRRLAGTHLTILQHVYGQPWQRSRTWMSLFLPFYGDAAVSLGNPADRAAPLALVDTTHNGISPWSPPRSDLGGTFLDARAYRVESRSPELAVIPARSTVKQLQFDWLGSPRWRMPRPEAYAGSDAEPRIELLPAGVDRPVLRGVIRHGLPGALNDVFIVVVRGQRPLARSLLRQGKAPLLADVVIQSLPEWPPDVPIDLSTIVQRSNNDVSSLAFLSDLVDKSGFTDDQELGRRDSGRAAQRLTAAMLYSQLQPPEHNLAQASPIEGRVALRDATHGFDLGRWFTQPCVIIIGQLGSRTGLPTPTPVFVRDGRFTEVETTGRTIITWVYPLPEAPLRPAAPETGGGG